MADLPFSSRRNPAKQGIAFSPILSFHDFLDYLPRKQLFKMTARVLYFGAVITLALIVLDHRGMIEKDAFYFYSQVLLILLLVISTSLLFQHLMKILTDRGQRIQLLNETKDLNDRLACAVDYQDVYRQVLQFAAKIFPGAETALYIHDEDYNQLTLAANSSPENQQPITRQTACLACLRQGDHGAHPFAVCRQEALLQSPLAPRPFCLALRDNARIIGMLYLKAPTGESLAREQIDLFETVDNELARVLAAAQEKKKRTEMALAQAIMAARMEIARDLHDTLGQNIAYLRMTLENLDEMGSNVRANTGGE